MATFALALASSDHDGALLAIFIVAVAIVVIGPVVLHRLIIRERA